jgi:hypothetical protein
MTLKFSVSKIFSSVAPSISGSLLIVVSALLTVFIWILILLFLVLFCLASVLDKNEHNSRPKTTEYRVGLLNKDSLFYRPTMTRLTIA